MLWPFPFLRGLAIALRRYNVSIEGSTQKLCEHCEAKTLHYLVRVNKLFSRWVCSHCQIRERIEEANRE